MPNELLLKVGTQIVFADHAGDFSPAAKTALEVGSPTNVQLSMASVANTAARESDKADLGALRAAEIAVMASFELASSGLTSGNFIELRWMPSPISTAANGNVMSTDGADAAAPSGIGTLDELVAASQYIGVFECTDDATPSVQTGYVGTFTPRYRYGSLLVIDNSGAAFHTDDVECHVVFDMNITEIQ